MDGFSGSGPRSHYVRELSQMTSAKRVVSKADKWVNPYSITTDGKLTKADKGEGFQFFSTQQLVHEIKLMNGIQPR